MKDAEMPSPVPLEQRADTHFSGGGPDPERLRYVTRLLSTQPLDIALLGVCLLSISTGRALHSPWASGLTTLVAVAFLLGTIRRWVPEYYQRRFGFVKPQEPSVKWFGRFMLTIVLLLFIGQPLAHYLDPRVAGLVDWVHLKISDPTHQIDLSPSFFWIAVFLSGLRWHVPRIERQSLIFVLGGLVAFSSIAVFGVLHPDARNVGLWKVLNAGGIGLSLIVMGLYAHIILIRTLPRVGEGDDE